MPRPVMPRPLIPRAAMPRPLLRLRIGVIALLPLGCMAPAGAAEWSRSVTVNQEVLASLPLQGAVPARPVQRQPAPAAAAVEYRWELLAELGQGPGGGGGAAAPASVYGYAKAPPALIRPGEAAQWIVGAGQR